MAAAAKNQLKPEKAGDRTLCQLLERLRELRRVSGQTQEQFSESAGISYKYYQAVEAGRKRELRLSTLERLAHAYGLEVWELLAPTKPAAGPLKRGRRSLAGKSG